MLLIATNARKQKIFKFMSRPAVPRPRQAPKAMIRPRSNAKIQQPLWYWHGTGGASPVPGRLGAAWHEPDSEPPGVPGAPSTLAGVT